MSQEGPEILLGRYVVQSEHQSGGMTTVYRGRDYKTDEPVAIKRFDRDRLLPDIEAEAYRREVEALSDLKHPHILEIRDHGVDVRGKPFLVLEWMSHDLLGHKRRGASAFRKWDYFGHEIALPLLKALAHTHARGRSHRDVKPANVLVADDGTIKLADFGVSKLKRHLQPRATLNDWASPPFSPKESNDGSYEFARDVFGFAAICVWAMSPSLIDDYKSLYGVLNSDVFDDDVRNLLARCLNETPEDRPGTAGVLEQEFIRLHQLRWADKVHRERKHCWTAISQAARSKIAEDIGNEDIDAIERFCQTDLNDDAYIFRAIDGLGTPNERINQDEYSVVGFRFVYRVVRHLRDSNQILVRGAFPKSTNDIAFLKQSASPSPVRFVISPEPGGIDANSAFLLIGRVLDEFESQQDKSSDETGPTGLFSAWNGVLDAIKQVKENRFAPIDFHDAEIDGRFVTLSLYESSSANNVRINDAIAVRHKDWSYVGTVCEISAESMALSFPERLDLSGFPSKGRAVAHLGGDKFSIDRQKDALQAISSGTNERADLKNLILKPETSRSPETGQVQRLCPSTNNGNESPDPSQDDAIRAAIAAQDILLIHGPPGTGKTTFIVAAIRELFARNPQARILLTSKNHVAIDHALKGLSSDAKELRLLRISSSNVESVAVSSVPLLAAEKLKQWREEVAQGTAAFLVEWAQSQGIDANEIATGVRLKQIARERARLPELREQIQQSENEIANLLSQRQSGERSAASIEADIQQLQSDADDLRQKLDSAKKVTADLEQTLRRLDPEAESYLKLSIAELEEWYDLLVGDSPSNKRAADIAGLQADWLDRFGDDPSFQSALCERSHVVAATCIGFAGRGGASDVMYDLCIIDEASTATATEALVPMQAAKRWVLVGDEMQLGTFEDEALASEEIRQKFEIPDEARKSLFELLQERLPSGCQRMLKVQYRMVPPIGNLISECFYKAKGGIKSHERPLDELFAAVFGKAVVWLSTTKMEDRRERWMNPGFVNQREVQIVFDTLAKINNAIERHQPNRIVSVLLLSAYSQQVKLLANQSRRQSGDFPYLSIECSTVDAVQGRQAELVFCSVTRSNPDNKAGFLKELSRTNVALSRAQEQLVIVGDDEFVRRAPNAEPLRLVFRHIEATPKDCAIKHLGSPRTQ